MASVEIPADYVSRPHILIVDDDERICSLLMRYLSERGLVCTAVQSTACADQALALCDYDLCLLDVMMPGEDGVNYAKRFRAERGDGLPIIFLTALGEAENRITGLSAGADDYLAKPFDPQELLLRIQVILKRTFKPYVQKIIALDNHELDITHGSLKHDIKGAVSLTDTEREILIAMAQKLGQAVSRDDLAESCGIPTLRAVDVQITRLRKKIEGDPKDAKIIQTIRGKGYVLRGQEKIG